MDFGERLTGLWKESGLKQYQLAKELHIVPSTLSGYINGGRVPDYKIIEHIADYFGVSTAYLLGETNVRKSSEEPMSVREGELMGLYRSLQPDKQELLIEQAHLYYKYDRKEKERKKNHNG